MTKDINEDIWKKSYTDLTKEDKEALATQLADLCDMKTLIAIARDSYIAEWEKDHTTYDDDATGFRS